MSQKFFLGDRVYINKLPKSQSHFEQECEAIVLYSYAEQYEGGNKNENQFSLYILPNQGETSWYYAENLELIEPDRFDLLPKSNIYRKNWEAKKARDKSIVTWLKDGVRQLELDQ